ncbi:MAG: hypothetical protein QM756_17750 [Polyangiaceae bacterium]
MKTNWAVKALPASLLALALCSAPGCSSTDSDACSANLSARIDAVNSSAAALVSAATKMQGELYVACANIAGMTGAKAADATDDNVKTTCAAASAAISANFKAGAKVEYVPGHCEVNASAQISCEGKCDVKAMCTEPGLDVRCEPGKLSVECDGSCTGDVSCEGSATVAAKCEGQCNGSCTGTCSGTCNGTCSGTCSAMDSSGKCAGTCEGMCEGSCSASCTGTCKGSCKLAANATVKCDSTVRCEGTCTGTAKAPRCEGTITPPMCSADADCSASCDSKASLEAECTPPTVTITGFAEANFDVLLRANMPVVYGVAAQAALVAEGAKNLTVALAALGDAVTAEVKCGLSQAAAITAQVQASAKASVSVSVSVEASASVSGSAAGG